MKFLIVCGLVFLLASEHYFVAWERAQSQTAIEQAKVLMLAQAIIQQRLQAAPKKPTARQPLVPPSEGGPSLERL